MEILLIAIGLALAIFALLFFWELRQTQSRADAIHAELDHRLRSAINQLSAESVEKIPGLIEQLNVVSKRLEACEAGLKEMGKKLRDKDGSTQ